MFFAIHQGIKHASAQFYGCASVTKSFQLDGMVSTLPVFTICFLFQLLCIISLPHCHIYHIMFTTCLSIFNVYLPPCLPIFHRDWVVTPTCNPKPIFGGLANSKHKDISQIVPIVRGVTIGGQETFFHEYFIRHTYFVTRFIIVYPRLAPSPQALPRPMQLNMWGGLGEGKVENGYLDVAGSQDQWLVNGL